MPLSFNEFFMQMYAKTCCSALVKGQKKICGVKVSGKESEDTDRFKLRCRDHVGVAERNSLRKRYTSWLQNRSDTFGTQVFRQSIRDQCYIEYIAPDEHGVNAVWYCLAAFLPEHFSLEENRWEASMITRFTPHTIERGKELTKAYRVVHSFANIIAEYAYQPIYGLVPISDGMTACFVYDDECRLWHSVCAALVFDKFLKVCERYPTMIPVINNKGIVVDVKFRKYVETRSSLNQLPPGHVTLVATT